MRTRRPTITAEPSTIMRNRPSSLASSAGRFTVAGPFSIAQTNGLADRDSDHSALAATGPAAQSGAVQPLSSRRDGLVPPARDARPLPADFDLKPHDSGRPL